LIPLEQLDAAWISEPDVGSKWKIQCPMFDNVVIVVTVQSSPPSSAANQWYHVGTQQIKMKIYLNAKEAMNSL
jgi:hypothetical protein